MQGAYATSCSSSPALMDEPVTRHIAARSLDAMSSSTHLARCVRAVRT